MTTFEAQLEALRPKLTARALRLTRNHDDALDLVQDAMIRAITAQDRFDGKNLAAWTFTILRNLFFTKARKADREEAWDDEREASRMDENASNSEQAVLAQERYDAAMRAVSDLSADARAALLSVAAGDKYDDVAQQLGVPVGTIKSRVSRARDAVTAAVRSEMNEPIRQRRFEELPTATPGTVTALADDHPAILQNLPLFETTMVSASESPHRVLVSGVNSRKIGKVVTKGAWKGFPIYTLTLAERMTCPSSCHMWRTCYGNAMPFARRHKPGADLEAKIETELAALALDHQQGFVVRLHVLGDFYSVEYVKLWERMLDKHPSLHAFGYTARTGDIKSPDIGNEVFRVRGRFPDRFCIRPSEPKPLKGAAVVINRVPEGATVAEGLVCPAERETTACCATCGLCWEAAARDKTIVFVRHGMGSKKSERAASEASRVDAVGGRQIAPLANVTKLARKPLNQPPTLLWVKAVELRVDEAYQRNLSGRSVRLISRIVQNWNWTHFKPPIVVKDEDTNDFFVIDGQHTAIAAASHPDIDKIPIMLVDADSLKERALGFISHNKNRITVTPAQIFYSSIVAGDAESIEINRICREADVTILRCPPANGQFKAGETLALSTIKTLIRKYGSEHTQQVLTCLRLAERAPVRADEMKAVAVLMFDEAHRPSAATVADLLKSISYDEAIRDARDIVADSFLPKSDALAAVFAKRLVREAA